MRTKLAGAAAAGLASVVLALAQPVAAGPPTAASQEHGIARVCAHALLFEHRHPIGTHAGALAVARDIRASAARRLARAAAVPAPASRQAVTARWIALERRLSAVYARTYVAIFEAIEQARTPAQQLPMLRTVQRLLHAPDALRATTARLELQLQVPDCTGG
jgi:hypothetical protein